jgi:arylsulfatase A-like enzyme
MPRRAWATRRLPGLFALRLSLVLSLAVAGCMRADAPLQPVHRLFRTLDPPLDQIPLHCHVGDVFRPTIGCVSYVPLGTVGLPRPEGRTLTLPVSVPAGLTSELMVFEPKVRGPREEWRRTPTMLLARPPSGKTELLIPLPDQVKGDRIEAQGHIRPVPPNHQERVTRALKIGSGARLSVALGLDALGAHLGGAPVRFRLAAEGSGKSTLLLEETLDPRTAKSWQEHTVDLGAFTGARVRFRFTTEVVPRAGSSSFGFPLWGSAQVLEPRAGNGHRNVILISLDTLRADQLGGTLSGIPLMPELDARAAQGARFTEAFTTYPSTTAGHMSIFTGLYPATHGMVFATGHLSPDIVTLPEIFADHGYATAAVTENAMLSAYVGFVRGFDSYREIKGKSLWETTGEIEQTFDAGLEWLERHPDERFFLFLHTYQVHTPYLPPAAYDLFKTREKDGVQVPIDLSTPGAIRDLHLYAGEVRYTDAVLERLFRRLDALDLLDETIVVVTSDHGDEFGEHGLIGHAKTVYDEVLHVPLVIFAPRLVPAGKRVDVPVSLVDLAPTLLDLTRLPIPSGLHGQSLVPLLRGEPFPRMRVLYAEAPKWGPRTGHRVAARTAGFKWIGSADPEVAMQVFDLTTDPGEQHPLDDPMALAPGAAFEAAYRAKAPVRADAGAARDVPGKPAKKPELDDATLEKLKALGYLD